MTDILLGIADILLAIIAIRGFYPARKNSTFFAQEPPPVELPLAPIEGDGIVDTESEYVIQERYIDDWVAEHCEPTHDATQIQHNRWEGLRHYKNRTKR